jgi:hypothetical protein
MTTNFDGKKGDFIVMLYVHIAKKHISSPMYKFYIYNNNASVVVGYGIFYSNRK